MPYLYQVIGECYFHGNMLTWQWLNTVIKEKREDIGTVRPWILQRRIQSERCDLPPPHPKPVETYPEVRFPDVSCNLATPLSRMTPRHRSTVIRKHGTDHHMPTGMQLGAKASLKVLFSPQQMLWRRLKWVQPTDFWGRAESYVITANQSRNTENSLKAKAEARRYTVLKMLLVPQERDGTRPGEEGQWRLGRGWRPRKPTEGPWPFLWALISEPAASANTFSSSS